MAEIFIGLVKQMVIFLIAGQTILHFGMGRQYEKYIKLIISLMIVANLISAFVSLWRQVPESGFAGKANFTTESFEERWQYNMGVFQEELEEKQRLIEEKWVETEKEQTGEEVKSGYSEIFVEEIVIK